jgi:hypothetical protein
MEKDIAKIKKNDETDIVVRIDDFGGKPGLTIREFVTSERYTGFTKSGTRISAENFNKFKEAINSINEADLKSSESTETQKEETNSKVEEQESVEDY